MNECLSQLGTGDCTKTDKFSETFHTHTQKLLFKGPKSAIYIIGLKVTPLPLGIFRKFIRFGTVARSLDK